MAGVGRISASMTRAPPLEAPAARAEASIPPERRVSRPMRIGPPKSRAAARPSRRASSGSRPSFAIPRAPSVPNVMGPLCKETSSARDGPLPDRPEGRRKGPASCKRFAALALGELRALAGLLEAVLLALDGAGVPGEEPRGLQLAARLLRLLGERPRDAVAQGVRLAGGATALEPGDHVVAASQPEQLQRRAHGGPVSRAGEVLVERTAVNRDIAVPREQPHARAGRLAPARPPVKSLRHAHLTSSS